MRDGTTIKQRYFSIIIPMFNKNDYIEKSISTVLMQDYPYWELIIIDDGSTDGSADKVLEIAKSDTRVKMISQENKGVSAARNAGIKNARFDEICFLDADDAWRPDHLSVLNELANRFPDCVMMFTQCLTVKNGTERGDPWFKNKSEDIGLLNSYCQAMTRSPNLINSSNVCIRKNLAGSALHFNELDTIGEDLDVWLRISCISKVAFCSRGCALYNRDTVQNARSQNAVHHPKGYLETINQLLSDDTVSAEDKAALCYVRDRKMVAYIFSLISCGDRAKARRVLSSWKAKSSFRYSKPTLWVACCFPKRLLEAIKSVRMRLT